MAVFDVEVTLEQRLTYRIVADEEEYAVAHAIENFKEDLENLVASGVAKEDLEVYVQEI